MTSHAEKVLETIRRAPGIESETLTSTVELTNDEILDAIRDLRREQLVESTWDQDGDGLLYFWPLGQGHQLELAAEG